MILKAISTISTGLSRTSDEHANTSGASIPLALDLAVKDGRVKRGDTLLMAAFGAGFTWGSAMIRF
jgi:3-oxoacyl-[acyl-carrier-protein] synthase-3